jgi:hypothetical protein
VAIEGVLRQERMDASRIETSQLAVDTHGYTDFAMMLARLLGFDLCPRLKELRQRHLFLPHGMAIPAEIANVCEATVDTGLIEQRLQDTVETTLEICRALEMNLQPVTTKRGLVCLSAYGLYKQIPIIGESGVDYTSLAGRWNRLMNSLPRLMDGENDLFEIAERFELPFEEVHAYVQQWIAHGLARAE